MSSTVTLNSANLGGAVLSAIDAVVGDGAQSLSIADAGTEQAFLDSWTRKFIDYAHELRSTKTLLEAPIVLIYATNWAKLGKSINWNSRRTLGVRMLELPGVLGVGALETGAYVSPTRILSTETMEEVIEQAQLGEFMTIGLMSTTELWVWPHGLSHQQPAYKYQLSDIQAAMTLDTLDEKLSEFYEQSARQTTTWWINPKKRIAVSDAEKIVQHDLWNFLLGVYGKRARVKQEVISGSGRTDLTIWPIDTSMDKSAVLELKVTKDFGAPKENTETPTPYSLSREIDWVISGVAQTASYRDDNRFDGAYLCVYDFRAGDQKSIDDAIQAAANPHRVYGRRYWITNSHEEHRTSRYPLHRPDPSPKPTRPATAATASASVSSQPSG